MVLTRSILSSRPTVSFSLHSSVCSFMRSNCRFAASYNNPKGFCFTEEHYCYGPRQLRQFRWRWSRRHRTTASPGIAHTVPASNAESKEGESAISQPRDLNGVPPSINAVSTPLSLKFNPANDNADDYYASIEKSLPAHVAVVPPSPRADLTKEPAVVENEASAGSSSQESRMSLWVRFKEMYKNYWYVVIPVHAVLCAGWYGVFYYLASRGFDVIPVLERMGVSETLLGYLKRTGAGYLAAAFAMYKLASPIRYSLTLGVTTFAINYLRKFGYIRPVPNREQMRKIFDDGKLKILRRTRGRRLRRAADHDVDKSEVLAKPSLNGAKSTKVSKQNPGA